MFKVMLSVELVMADTGNKLMMVSRGREISNQVHVSGCDDGQVEDDIVNQMTGNWELRDCETT